jgi:DNA-binding MarR family transcriptional regulator
MTAPIDRGHMRHVGLTLPEVKTLGLLAEQGGDIRWYGERVKPETNLMIDVLIGKGLVELVTRFGGAIHLRLTDQGRAVAAQLEAMNVAPKVVVNTTGETAPGEKS